MTGNEIANLLSLGIQPVVRFNDQIDKCECYLEPGMIGRISGVLETGDECLKIQISLVEFEEHNFPLETETWNVFKDGKMEQTTCRKAGNYKGTEAIFMDLKYETLFDLLDQKTVTLMEAWKKSESKLKYTEWLESMLYDRMPELQPAVNGPEISV